MASQLAATVLIVTAMATAARAQTVDTGAGAGAAQETKAPAAPVFPPVEHLFGDWGGVRTSLEQRGVNVVFDAVTEFAGNVSGGVKQGATFANQIGLEIDLDFNRLAGISGLTTHAIVVNRSGANASTLFGDNLLPVQEIYGAGGNVAVHLVSIYAQQVLFDDALSVAAGRMNVENDFASSPLYCNFMNNVLCGDPKALPGGDIGHSAYPDGVWAARARVRPRPDFYVATGVYEVNQGLYTDKYFRSGFEFDTSQDSGVYLPVEIGWEPAFGSAKLPGHYKLGFGHDSSPFQDFAVAPSADRPTHRGNTQIWALFDQMLLRHGDGDTSGLIALLALVRNDPARSVYAEQYTAALTDHGFWAARPKDGVGLMFSYNTVSGSLGKVQASQLEFGLPVSNNATGIQTREMVLEANYDIHVARGVDFQPEFQYIFRPNAQSNIHDAAVLGFKAHVSF